MRKAADTGIPVTAKEIGRQLGLSQPTVSRILSGADGHRVSSRTRQRVLETAASMGYRPNALARSLRRGSTNIIGFYTGYGYLDARNPFQSELLGNLQRSADTRRLDILLHGVFRGASTDDIYGELLDGRIDGLFIHTHADDPLVVRLRQSSLPVVAVADAVPGIPSVVADDEGGMRILMEELWSRGHRRIGYLRPAKKFSSVERRLAAFKTFLAERGASAESVYELDFEYTRPALDAILATPEEARPTAVCCWNDMSAFDLLYNCRLRKISVPETLAIAGFDGLLTDPRLAPRPLVTVGASWTEIAEYAMCLLLQQINRPQRNHSDAAAADDDLPEPALLTCMPVSLREGDTV